MPPKVRHKTFGGNIMISKCTIKKWRWQCGATALLATKETLVSRRSIASATNLSFTKDYPKAATLPQLNAAASALLYLIRCLTSRGKRWFPNAIKRIAGWRRKHKYFCLPPCKYSIDTHKRKKKRGTLLQEFLSIKSAKGRYSPTTKCSTIGATILIRCLTSRRKSGSQRAKRIAGRRRKQKYFCLPPCKYSLDTPNTKKDRNSFARIPIYQERQRLLPSHN